LDRPDLGARDISRTCPTTDFRLLVLLCAAALASLLATPAQAQTSPSSDATPSVATASAPGAEAVLAAAADLFAEGAYGEAADAYQALVDDGLHDAALYHNLGHALYREGDHGRAILSYERAARLAPRDANIRASLAQARRGAEGLPSDKGVSSLVDRAGRGTASTAAVSTQLAGPTAWLDWLEIWLARAELARLVLVLWWLCVLCVILARHRRPGRLRRALRAAAGAAAVGMAIGALVWTAWTYELRARPRAIVIAPGVEVAGGPGPATEFAAIARLAPGTAVRLLETRGHFTRAALADGREGWVPVAAVERVE